MPLVPAAALPQAGLHGGPVLSGAARHTPCASGVVYCAWWCHVGCVWCCHAGNGGPGSQVPCWPIQLPQACRWWPVGFCWVWELLESMDALKSNEILVSFAFSFVSLHVSCRTRKARLCCLFKPAMHEHAACCMFLMSLTPASPIHKVGSQCLFMQATVNDEFFVCRV